MSCTRQSMEREIENLNAELDKMHKQKWEYQRKPLVYEGVEPVKHGRWVKNIRGNYAKVCSECGAGILANAYTPILLDCNRASNEREQMCNLADVVKYCPNCGAKMDEVSE